MESMQQLTKICIWPDLILQSWPKTPSALLFTAHPVPTAGAWHSLLRCWYTLIVTLTGIRSLVTRWAWTASFSNQVTVPSFEWTIGRRKWKWGLSLPRNFLGGLLRSPVSGCTTHRSSTRLGKGETWTAISNRKYEWKIAFRASQTR